MSEQDYYEVRLTNKSVMLILVLLVILCSLFFMMGRISVKQAVDGEAALAETISEEAEAEPEIPDLSFYEIARNNDKEPSESSVASPPPAEPPAIKEKVPVEIKTDENKPPAEPDSVKPESREKQEGGYSVQVAAFRSSGDAEGLKKKLTDTGYKTYIIKDNDLYKVRVGRFSSEATARSTSDKLAKSGYKNWVVRE